MGRVDHAGGHEGEQTQECAPTSPARPAMRMDHHFLAIRCEQPSSDQRILHKSGTLVGPLGFEPRTNGL
jgi:hypothetical protein